MLAPQNSVLWKINFCMTSCSYTWGLPRQYLPRSVSQDGVSQENVFQSLDAVFWLDWATTVSGFIAAWIKHQGFGACFWHINSTS